MMVRVLLLVILLFVIFVVVVGLFLGGMFFGDGDNLKFVFEGCEVLVFFIEFLGDKL